MLTCGAGTDGLADGDELRLVVGAVVGLALGDLLGDLLDDADLRGFLFAMFSFLFKLFSFLVYFSLYLVKVRWLNN